MVVCRLPDRHHPCQVGAGLQRRKSFVNEFRAVHAGITEEDHDVFQVPALPGIYDANRLLDDFPVIARALGEIFRSVKNLRSPPGCALGYLLPIRIHIDGRDKISRLCSPNDPRQDRLTQDRPEVFVRQAARSTPCGYDCGIHLSATRSNDISVPRLQTPRYRPRPLHSVSPRVRISSINRRDCCFHAISSAPQRSFWDICSGYRR